MKSLCAAARSLCRFSLTGRGRPNPAWSTPLSARWGATVALGLIVASAPACNQNDKKPEPAIAQVVAPATPQPAPAPKLSAPLQIGYSDWPGFVALEVPAVKGWFAEAGLDVKLVWFEYVPSLEAFQAGKLDA